MAYAVKNIKLNIKRPGVAGRKVVFTTCTSANDHFRIPRRYPFVDINDYAFLKTDGYFRHETTAVTDKFNTSVSTNTEGGLGFELPNTEKLILLAKKGASGKETVTLEGSIEYGIDPMTVELPAGAVGDLYEVDLYDFGLYISGIAGEDGLMIKADNATVGLALIARMA